MDAYVVTSSSSINDIKDVLQDTGEKWWAVKIIYTRRANSIRGGKKVMETDKTIVICTPNCIEKFKNIDRYTVTEYDWDSFPKPKDEGDTQNLHFSGIPNFYNEKQARAFIFENLNGIVSPENIRLNFPLESRERGNIKGHGKLTFSDSIPFSTRCLCKIILHNTPITVNTGYNRMMICHWYRDNKITGMKPLETSRISKIIQTDEVVRVLSIN